MGAPLKELAISRQDIFYIDPMKLRVKNDFNSRFADDPANQEHIEFLSKSIAEIGVREPLTVFRENDETYVSDGHCRLAATLLAIHHGAEIKSIPVKTEPRGASEADRYLRQVLEGKTKTPLEQGVVYKKLISLGWSVQMIAQKAGKSVPSVNAALDLQEAPAEAQKMVAEGQVSSTLATQVLKKSGALKGTAQLKEAVEKAAAKGKKKATKKHVTTNEETAPVQKSPSRVLDNDTLDRLIKHLVTAARAGDERIEAWLNEAGLSVD